MLRKRLARLFNLFIHEVFICVYYFHIQSPCLDWVILSNFEVLEDFTCVVYWERLWSVPVSLVCIVACTVPIDNLSHSIISISMSICYIHRLCTSISCSSFPSLQLLFSRDLFIFIYVVKTAKKSDSFSFIIFLYIAITISIHQPFLRFVF